MLSRRMEPKSFLCELSFTFSLTVPGTTRGCRRLVVHVHWGRRRIVIGAVGPRRTLRLRRRLRSSGSSGTSPGATGRRSVVGVRRAGARLAGQVAVVHGALGAANGLTNAAHRVFVLGNMVSMFDSTAAL